MSVQDSARERDLCQLFNLSWEEDHERSGTDAFFDTSIRGKRLRVPVEVKSTTGHSVSTARDVGREHIARWREKLWVIGFYQRGGKKLDYCLCLTPDEMAPWIAAKEAYIGPDLLIGERISARLEMEDLAAVCGIKPRYTLEDARRILKKQWTGRKYEDEFDVPATQPTSYSPEKMLGILRLRAKYIHRRGATLNNPHISKTFFDGFASQRIFRDHSARLRAKYRRSLAESINSRAPAAPDQAF